MNGIQTKRAVYYGLLISCLAGALLTMFLPFGYQWIEGNIYYALVKHSLVPVSVLHCLTGDMAYKLLGWSWELSDYLKLFLMLFTLATAIMLIRSLLRALRSLNNEISSFETVSLGKGPVLGICFFAFLLFLGILNQRHLNADLMNTFWFPPIWPLAGLFLNCASLGLARALNP